MTGAALAAAASAQAQKLVIKGSDTLGAKLVPSLAEEYKAKNPGVSFEIAAEGSTTGLTAIIDSTAQIGMSSRRAKPTEVSAAQAKGVNERDAWMAANTAVLQQDKSTAQGNPVQDRLKNKYGLE